MHTGRLRLRTFFRLGPLGRHRVLTRFVSASMLSVILATALIAGTPPALLDDNRGNLLLAAVESAALNVAYGIAGFFVNPLTFTYPPIIIDPRVLHHPKIHNLYLDDDWDAHNPDAPTRAQLDAFTQELVNSAYFNLGNQYGVSNAEFTGSHQREFFCGLLEPISGNAEFVELIAWVSCMVGFNPIPLPPGTLDPISGAPSANDNSLYVIYLPRNTTIVEGGCGSFQAYHFFGAAPHLDFTPLPPFVIPRSQTFAFAVVSTACFSGSATDIRNGITKAASHEIIEAATDPLVGTGWINNDIVTEGDSFFEDLIRSFSNIPTDLRSGETADICSSTGVPSGPPAFPKPTPPIPIPAVDPSLGGSFNVAAYWSNSDGDCGPFVPKSTLTLGSPHFGQFVSSATTLTIGAVDGGGGAGVASLSFRFYPQGTPPPAFTTVSPPATFSVSGADGNYTVDMFATGNNGMVEVTHTSTVTLDNSAPVITIVQPTATDYPHSAVLTLNYSANDGSGSGVASKTGSMDGATTLAGHGLDSGQPISLLLELALGPHTFGVSALDNVNNNSVKSVIFNIVVTAESIKEDVNIFVANGMIKDPGIATSLLAKLNNAAIQRAKGKCDQAENLYNAFINEVQAQSGAGIDPVAAAIMIADAQYLIARCP